MLSISKKNLCVKPGRGGFMCPIHISKMPVVASVCFYRSRSKQVAAPQVMRPASSLETFWSTAHRIAVVRQRGAASGADTPLGHRPARPSSATGVRRRTVVELQERDQPQLTASPACVAGPSSSAYPVAPLRAAHFDATRIDGTVAAGSSLSEALSSKEPRMRGGAVGRRRRDVMSLRNAAHPPQRAEDDDDDRCARAATTSITNMIVAPPTGMRAASTDVAISRKPSFASGWRPQSATAADGSARAAVPRPTPITPRSSWAATMSSQKTLLEWCASLPLFECFVQSPSFASSIGSSSGSSIAGPQPRVRQSCDFFQFNDVNFAHLCFAVAGRVHHGGGQDAVDKTPPLRFDILSRDPSQPAAETVVHSATQWVSEQELVIGCVVLACHPLAARLFSSRVTLPTSSWAQSSAVVSSSSAPPPPAPHPMALTAAYVAQRCSHWGGPETFRSMWCQQVDLIHRRDTPSHQTMHDLLPPASSSSSTSPMDRAAGASSPPPPLSVAPQNFLESPAGIEGCRHVVRGAAGPLIFTSKEECGNLAKVERRVVSATNEPVYLLWLGGDGDTEKRIWFSFSILLAEHPMVAATQCGFNGTPPSLCLPTTPVASAASNDTVVAVVTPASGSPLLVTASDPPAPHIASGPTATSWQLMKSCGDSAAAYNRSFRFRVMNLSAGHSRLYRNGMKPVYRLLRFDQLGDPDSARWYTASNVKYTPTYDAESGAEHGHLMFSVPIRPRSTVKVDVAFTVPYGYFFLLHQTALWHNMVRMANLNIRLEERVLCRSPEGRKVHLFIISSVSDDNAIAALGSSVVAAVEQQGAAASISNCTATHLPYTNFREGKKVVLISARVHPGEVAGSHALHALIQLLLSDSAEAQLLRRWFVFFVVPMLNPDGVARGHSRHDQFGVNLNRTYDRPDAAKQPTVVALRNVYQHLKETYGRRFMLYLDFHAHASQPRAFVFGNHMYHAQRMVHNMLLPKLIEAHCPNEFDFEACKFSKADMVAKEGSSRVIFGEHLVHSYTVEVSHFSHHLPAGGGAAHQDGTDAGGGSSESSVEVDASPLATMTPQERQRRGLTGAVTDWDMYNSAPGKVGRACLLALLDYCQLTSSPQLKDAGGLDALAKRARARAVQLATRRSM